MIKRWRTISQNEPFYGRIFRYRQVRRCSTTQTMEGDFDVLDFSDWVNIVALTEDKRVLLVRQYRQGVDDVTLEIPGGAVHRAEDPLLAAQRELREETGHEAKTWLSLGTVQPNPAIQSNTCHIYLAQDCFKVGEPMLDPLEELEVESVPSKELRQLVNSGTIRHSLVMSAVLLAGEHL